MSKRIAVILIEHFAEWEFGFLTSVARDYLGATISYHTPGGKPVTAEGGLRALPDGAIEDIDPTAFDALLVVGSARWDSDEAPDIAPLIHRANDAGRILGFICMGRLAATQAGLMTDAPDLPHAIRNSNIIVAPGSAPVTFAIEMLNALWPEKNELFAGYYADLAREHGV